MASCYFIRAFITNIHMKPLPDNIVTRINVGAVLLRHALALVIVSDPAFGLREKPNVVARALLVLAGALHQAIV